MKISTTHSNDSRSTFKRFARIATALAFGGLLCAFPLSSALAAHHGGGGHGGGHGGYHGGYHGGDHHWGGGHWDGHHWGGGYYAPGPDYYVAPEPYAYYGPGPCYGPYYDYNCGPPPGEGMGLFFGL
jgi:hypothetical protein